MDVLVWHDSKGREYSATKNKMHESFPWRIKTLTGTVISYCSRGELTNLVKELMDNYERKHAHG